MNRAERMSRVAALFADGAASVAPRSLCGTSVAALLVSSAGLTLMSGDHSSPVCASDTRAGDLDDLQFALGEGPCPDAHRSRTPIFEPDLEGASTGRWPQFAPAAVDVGVRGVFAFPLNAGVDCIGVLTLYQDAAGDLTPDQAADGPLVAEALVRSMLTIQSGSGPDVLARELIDVDAHRAEVHQATGMVAVQLGIAITDAALRLRAFAYASGRSVAAVARDIVDRRVRLADDADRDEAGGVPFE
ncbi:MAG: ANTAR domain-containing protein [Acidimicrobiia bacterium]|nr:ANTAR domain-containing protein [Acidimicrobiia bacterium]